MRRGEVWWADCDERRAFVLLSAERAGGHRAMQVVAPAGVDLGGLGVEIPVGTAEGLLFEGVLRFAFPRSGFTPCTWLTTLYPDDLVERAGTLPGATLDKIDDALRRAEQPARETPAASAKLAAIRDALRRGALG